MPAVIRLNEINPSGFISRASHDQEKKKDVSAWFADEFIEIDFGDTVGRPSENILLQKEYITRFLENGWTIDKVISASSEGKWESVISGSSASVESSSSSSSTSGSDTNSHTSSSSSSAESSSSRSTSSDSYWEARQKVRLKRRRMQPEKVMQSVTDSFTDAYNNGHQIDDKRFNELMSFYYAIFNTAQADANNLLYCAINSTNPTYFIDKLYSSIWNDMTAAHNRAVEITSNASENAKIEINRQFNTLIAQAKAQMISNGTYNGTVWPTTLAGIERERSAALLKAKNEALQISANAYVSVGAAKTNAASVLLDAQNAIQKAIDSRQFSAIEIRNNVAKWILDYASTRQEVYPELEEIATVAERMGFSVGSAGNVL